jgi:hypothetical protein
MRSIRAVLGAAVLLCVFGTVAAPAFAKKAKPPVVFGKFTASFPSGKPISPTEEATAKGHGELDVLNLANGALRIEECYDVKSSGMVDEESSEGFFQNVTFKHCYATVTLNPGFTEKLKLPSFTLAMEFRSNKSVELGEGAENELEIVRPSTVSIPVGKKSPCRVTIPAQTAPKKAEGKPEKEYGAAGYETEMEVANKKKFPSGIQERLDIGMEFSKLEAWVKPNEHCVYGAGEEGSYDSNPETPGYGYVVYTDGALEAELEEITIKNGDLGFEPKPEV